MHDRKSVIRFIEDAYFGRVSDARVDDLLACFSPDAKVIIRHGDNPERRFGFVPTGAETALSDFYAHLCGNYEAWFGDFEHTIDLGSQRAASRFTVRLTPKPDGLYADAGVQELLNCNFFEFEDGRISHMIIYYANPDPGDDRTDQPTGYPPA